MLRISALEEERALALRIAAFGSRSGWLGAIHVFPPRVKSSPQLLIRVSYLMSPGVKLASTPSQWYNPLCSAS